MNVGEIRLGKKRFRPDLARHQLKEKLGTCLNTTSYVLVAGCIILFVKNNNNNNNINQSTANTPISITIKVVYILSLFFFVRVHICRY